MEGDIVHTVAEVRKLRKKLRQIESLERLDRPLNHEETLKVAKKGPIRLLLREKLKLMQEDISITPDNSSTTPEDFAGEEAVRGLGGSSHEWHADRARGPQEIGVDAKMKRAHAGPGKPEEKSQETGDESDGVKRLKEDPSRTSASCGGGAAHVPVKKGEGAALKSQKDGTPGASSRRTPQRQKSEAERRRERWSKLRFSIQDLEGHNDLISSVDCKDGVILSGSRDTTVKAWDLNTGAEKCSLGGHSGAVTSVRLLTAEETYSMASYYDLDPTACQVALSSSTDCSVRLWEIVSHKEIASIYTYNPVTAMDVLSSNMCIVTGSAGGKVDMWDITSGENCFSSLAHEGSITCIKVKGQNLATSSSDGIIKLWELRERSLHVIFASENVRSESPEGALVQRPILSLGLAGGLVYYGDDGTNVKILDWRNGTVRKLCNHLGDFGSTDAMHLSGGDVLVFSSYDLDSGVGSINFFSPHDHQYLGSLSDPTTCRIESMSSPDPAGPALRLITAGQELRVWEMVTDGRQSAEDVIAVTFEPALALPAEDSADDFSGSETSGDEGSARGSHRRSRKRGSSTSEPERSSWMSWCSIV